MSDQTGLPSNWASQSGRDRRRASAPSRRSLLLQTPAAAIASSCLVLTPLPSLGDHYGYGPVMDQCSYVEKEATVAYNPAVLFVSRTDDRHAKVCHYRIGFIFSHSLSEQSKTLLTNTANILYDARNLSNKDKLDPAYVKELSSQLTNASPYLFMLGLPSVHSDPPEYVIALVKGREDFLFNCFYDFYIGRLVADNPPRLGEPMTCNVPFDGILQIKATDDLYSYAISISKKTSL